MNMAIPDNAPYPWLFGGTATSTPQYRRLPGWSQFSDVGARNPNRWPNQGYVDGVYCILTAVVSGTTNLGCLYYNGSSWSYFWNSTYYFGCFIYFSGVNRLFILGWTDWISHHRRVWEVISNGTDVAPTITHRNYLSLGPQAWNAVGPYDWNGVISQHNGYHQISGDTVTYTANPAGSDPQDRSNGLLNEKLYQGGGEYLHYKDSPTGAWAALSDNGYYCYDCTEAGGYIYIRARRKSDLEYVVLRFNGTSFSEAFVPVEQYPSYPSAVVNGVYSYGDAVWARVSSMGNYRLFRSGP